MSRFSSPSYEVGRSTGVCAATQQPIGPGEQYMATLCEREDDDGFVRLDFRMDAWETGHRPERLYSFWRTCGKPLDNRKALVDDAVLVNLFERLECDEQPQRQAYRFVLALVLMRKKKLKLTGTRRDGDATYWLLRYAGDPPDAPVIEVIDPQLDKDRSREVADQLGEILRGDL